MIANLTNITNIEDKYSKNVFLLSKKMFVDTHTHLYIEEFSQDIHEVISESLELGVKQMILPAIEQKYTEQMKLLKSSYPNNIHLMMGLHPCYVKENYQEELSHVEEELKKGIYVAVGEIGIDLYWDTSTLTIQQDAFEKQINLAKQHQLPIVIHGRNSFDEIFEVLEQHQDGSLRGVFHCFSGNYEQAQKTIDLGLKLGIGGVVTFKNGKIDQYINQIPLEHIILETDAPYLAPVPYRGKRNKSSYIPLIAQKLSELYQCDLDHIAKQTTQNAAALFQINFVNLQYANYDKI